MALDSSGDLYIADTANNRVQEVAAATGTQWGQSMTANDIYTVAGSSSGTSGYTGDGGAATSALLNGPSRRGSRRAGDLYIADYPTTASKKWRRRTGSQWGISMTANDIYTIAGGSSGSRLSAGRASRPADLDGPSRSQSTQRATSSSPTPATTGSKKWPPPPAPSGGSP